MRRMSIRRSLSMALGVVVVVGGALGTRAALASGGGGCGRRVTDARATTISIKSFCFTPTILRIRPGQTVTWTNRDPFPHTVIGANATWGSFEVLKAKHEVTYRFVRPGVYSYVCTFHPGMVGTVVVGNANGPGAAGPYATATGPVTAVSPTPASGPGTTALEVGRAAPPRIDAGAWPWVAAVAFGLLVVVSTALMLDRRRRRSTVTS